MFYSSLEHFQEEFEDVSKEDQVISHIVMQLCCYSNNVTIDTEAT